MNKLSRKGFNASPLQTIIPLLQLSTPGLLYVVLARFITSNYTLKTQHTVQGKFNIEKKTVYVVTVKRLANFVLSKSNEVINKDFVERL